LFAGYTKRLFTSGKKFKYLAGKKQYFICLVVHGCYVKKLVATY